MMNKFMLGLVLLGLIGSACAEAIKIVKSNFAFPVPAQDIAEFAAANIKLYGRYKEETKRFGPVFFQSAYVASIIGGDGLKYIFVGFPMKKDSEGTYMTVMQYCDKVEEYKSYELISYGLDATDTEEIYKKFIDANGTSLTQLSDACEQYDKPDNEELGTD